MPTASRAVCEECGAPYIIQEGEAVVLPTMRLRPDSSRRKPKLFAQMTKWVDWVEHVMTHCPQCRYKEVPQRCIDDLAAHQDKRRDTNAAWHKAEEERRAKEK